MMAVLACGLCLLLLRAPGVFPRRTCSPKDVLDHLNLTRNNEKFTNSRPVLDWTHPTKVNLDIILTAIVSVIEKSQIFVSALWMSATWNNELISWRPEDFCGMTHVSVPKEMLWKPDLFIYELTDKENSRPSPYLRVSYDGDVTMEEDLRLVSSCKMDVHKFPFDTQRCQISISSAIHANNEMKLFASSNSSRTTQNTRVFLLTQGEWELLGMTVSEEDVSLTELGKWDVIRYTVSIRRMPLLYVLNFQVPVLFLLIIDLASFFIPDSSGEKLSFKVTVLLAISVLLLILNDILPSKSDHCPLMATYVTFILAFMLLSLLETILVTRLMELDSPKENVSEDERDSSSELEILEIFTKQNGEVVPKKGAERVQGSTSSGGNSSCNSRTTVDGTEVAADLRLLQLISEQLQALKQNVAALVPKPRGSYWSRVAKRINVAFFVFYFSTMFVFLLFISLEWMKES